MECPSNCWRSLKCNQKNKDQRQLGKELPIEIHSVLQQGYALASSLFKYIIQWVLGHALQDYRWVRLGANVHVSDLGYTDIIAILSSSYRDMQGLAEGVTRQTTAAGMRSNTSLMSAFIEASSAKPSGLIVSFLRIKTNEWINTTVHYLVRLKLSQSDT